MLKSPSARAILLATATFVACKPAPTPVDTAAVKQQAAAAITVNKDSAPHPDWSKNAVIYEVNVRQYTPQGTIAAAQVHLPRLKKLGIDMA